MAKSTINADPEVQDFAGPVEESLFEDRSRAYDPTMDPASPRWDPKRYFGAQPKEIVVVKRSASDILGDPTGEKEIRIQVSINGYPLPGGIAKGVPTRVPHDFAEHLVGIGAAYRYADIPDPLDD